MTPPSGFVSYLRGHPNLIRAVSVALFFILWETLGRDANPLFMTYPSAIGRAAWEITLNGELWRALQQSMVPLAIGLAISIVGGVAIGVLMGQFWFIEYTIDPFVNALYAAEGTRVIIDAIKRAAPAIEKGKDPTEKREALRKAIAATKNYEGINGKWSFDENGDVDYDTMSGFKAVKADGPLGCKFQFESILE